MADETGKPDAAIPGDGRRPDPDTRMLRVFRAMLHEQVDRGELSPAVVVLRDLDGRFHAFKLDEVPRRVPAFVVAKLTDREVVEAAFAVDRWAKAGQDVAYADLLTVYHWRRAADGAGPDWRMAVVEYRTEPTHLKPYDWHNPFWTRACAADIDLLDRATAEARRPVGRDAARSHP